MARKTTQRALYTSMISIVACAMMLFGATFAWFTMSTSSDASTLLAQDFDVTVTVNDGTEPLAAGDVIATTAQTVVDEGESPHNYMIAFARTGGGAAAGHCAITIRFDSVTTNTNVSVSYDPETGARIENADAQVTNESQTRTFYTRLAGETTGASFTLNLRNCDARVQSIDVSWGDYQPAEGSIGVKSRGLLRAAPQTPSTIEISGDDMSFSFGEANTYSVGEPTKPDVTTLSDTAIAALLESGVITEEDVAALAPAADPKEEQNVGTGSAEPTDDTQTTMNGDNNDGENDNDNADTGTGNDGNGSGAGGSGSAGSGGGSGAGGGESESGAGGSGAG